MELTYVPSAFQILSWGKERIPLILQASLPWALGSLHAQDIFESRSP